ncbi:MAG: galactose-1-phosphate uridylyltransferase [Deltaproteobacteria bacterium]|nr:galactose-1-phosphate uridylyltransferase [Deltaproteobacteria bacterium]
MPELRKDPIIGRWVIISTERAKRPSDFGIAPETPRGGFCPFCPGNEDKTPPEILAYRQAGTPPNRPGWTLRVVANRFPALRIEGELDRQGDGIYDWMNGVGAHEVIIESPNHEDTLTTVSPRAMEELLWAYRDRLLDLRKDTRFRYALIFKNHGQAAGASLEHTHSQLIALPIVPKNVLEEMDGAQKHWGLKERCIFCDIIRQEIQQQARVVTEDQHFLVLSPFAPRFPFETWVLPKRHDPWFENSSKPEMEALARTLSGTLRRIEKVLGNPPYNYILHNAPVLDGKHVTFHWHIEIMPTLTRVAGFEWGSGFYINPTPPEEAAQFLRNAQP